MMSYGLQVGHRDDKTCVPLVARNVQRRTLQRQFQMICPDCKHDAFAHNAERCTHEHVSSALVMRKDCDCRFSRGDVIDRHEIGADMTAAFNSVARTAPAG